MGEGIRTRPYRFSALKLDELPLSYLMPQLAYVMSGLVFIGIILFLMGFLYMPIVQNSLFVFYNEVLNCLIAGILAVTGVNLMMAYAGAERQFYWKAWSFGFTPTALGLFEGSSNEPTMSFAWSDVQAVTPGARGKVFLIHCDDGNEEVDWRIDISSFESQADWNLFIAVLRQQRVPGYELLPQEMTPRKAGQAMDSLSDGDLAPEPSLGVASTCSESVAVEVQNVRRLDSFALIKYSLRFCLVGLVAGMMMLDSAWHPLFGQNCMILSLFGIILCIPAGVVVRNLLNPAGPHKVVADTAGLHLVHEGGRTVTTYEWNEFARVVAGQGRLRFIAEDSQEAVLVTAGLPAHDRVALAQLLQSADVWGWEWVADALASPDATQPLNPQSI